MSKSNTWENGIVGLLFNNTAFTSVGDASGLTATGTPGSLYISLHTADPGEAGNQSTNEVTTGEYNTYARVAVARSGAGWTVTNDQATNAATISFAASTGGTGATVTHYGIGTDSSGAGKLLYSSTISPNKSITSGDTPSISAGAIVVTEG